MISSVHYTEGSVRHYHGITLKCIQYTEQYIYASHCTRLTGGRPIHVLKSDIEVKLIVTSACHQGDVDSTTLSDGVVLLSKGHLNSCR